MKRRGFTIIELIIVVTIMGILLTIGVVNLRGSQANGRDAERKVDVDTIALHLETYYTSGIDATGTSSSDCTGGTITHNGGYTIHTFTVSSTLTCTSSYSADVLVVGGGGGGAGQGGGGGGGVVVSTSVALSGSMGVTVGGGGAGKSGTLDATQGGTGGSSTFAGLTAGGGGGGGAWCAAGAAGAASNGSGGGGGGSGSGTYSGGAGASGGHSGGAGIINSGRGGGGGGSSADGASSTNGGAGGSGSSVTLNGTNYGPYAGGGGGGSWAPPAGAASGGSGGGGASGIADGTGPHINNGIGGTANTGGGGGGGGNSQGDGGAGGSGIVIIRYPTPTAANTHTVTYPSTALTATTASMIQYLRDIDTKSITAPGITDPTLTFISATCTGVCVQTTAGVLPQPTKDQYIYQPIHSDGSLCNDAAECRKFNLYYKLENATTDCPAPNNICMITSRNQ